MKPHFLLLLFLMLSSLGVIAQDTERYATVTNVKTSLNMREKMSTKSSIVGKIPKGERVQVGSFGGDVKGKTYFDGTIHGENGKWYEKTNDGKVIEKE